MEDITQSDRILSILFVMSPSPAFRNKAEIFQYKRQNSSLSLRA
jgi:hypothetical protein